MSAFEFCKCAGEAGKTVPAPMLAAGDWIEDCVNGLDSNAADTLAYTSILKAVWGSCQNVLCNRIGRCLSSLGKRLDTSGCTRHIVTLRGPGYRLATPDAKAAIL